MKGVDGEPLKRLNNGTGRYQAFEIYLKRWHIGSFFNQQPPALHTLTLPSTVSHAENLSPLSSLLTRPHPSKVGLIASVNKRSELYRSSRAAYRIPIRIVGFNRTGGKTC